MALQEKVDKESEEAKCFLSNRAEVVTDNGIPLENHSRSSER